MLAVSSEEDFGPGPERGCQNGLVLRWQGGFRAGCDLCGNLQFAQERMESGHPIGFFSGKVSSGFLDHAGMGEQDGVGAQGVQEFSHGAPDLGTGEKDVGVQENFHILFSSKLFFEEMRDGCVVLAFEFLKPFVGIKFYRKGDSGSDEDALRRFFQGNQTAVAEVEFFPHFLGKGECALGSEFQCCCHIFQITEFLETGNSICWENLEVGVVIFGRG